MMRILIVLLSIMFYIPLQAQNDEPPPINNEAPLIYVEKMPEFKGGIKEMNQFINTKLQYPESCRGENTILQVIVQFEVDTMGYINNPKVIRGFKCGCNEEAIKVVKLMNENGPHWNSGIHNSKKVNVNFTIPIKFDPDKK